MHLEIIFKDPNRKKIFLSKTKTLCAVILSYHLLTWFTGCPFRFFFGISCPGCGMTRALPFFLLGYYLDPWINWSRHYLLLGSVAALFVFTYLVRLLFLHDPVVTWHPASGTLLKPFFHLLNIKLPG